MSGVVVKFFPKMERNRLQYRDPGGENYSLILLFACGKASFCFSVE
jgi:hypothetical protein